MEKRQRAIEFDGRSDSITVSKHANGNYSWSIKLYYDATKSKVAYREQILAIEKIDKELKKRFKSS